MGMAESWDASSVTQLLSPSLALASTVSGLMSFLVGLSFLVTNVCDNPWADSFSSRFTFRGRGGVSFFTPGISLEFLPIE